MGRDNGIRSGLQWNVNSYEADTSVRLLTILIFKNVSILTAYRKINKNNLHSAQLYFRSMAGANISYSGSMNNYEIQHQHQPLMNPIAISDSSSEDERDSYDYPSSSHHHTVNNLPRGRDAHNKCCNNKLWCVRVNASFKN